MSQPPNQPQDGSSWNPPPAQYGGPGQPAPAGQYGPPGQYGAPGQFGPPGEFGPPGQQGQFGAPSPGGGRGKVIGIVAGVVAVVAAVVLVLVFTVFTSGDDDRGGGPLASAEALASQLSSAVGDAGGPARSPGPLVDASAPPEGLGDDDTLDGLAQDCFDGDMQACDDLFLDSARGSDYETYGDTCAGRQPAGTGQYCTVTFPDA